MKIIKIILLILILFGIMGCSRSEKTKSLLQTILGLWIDQSNSELSRNVQNPGYKPNPNETPFQGNPPDELLATDANGNPVSVIAETQKDFVPPEPINFGTIPSEPTSVPECPAEYPCNATVLKPNVDVDRYQDIVIQFSHSMDLPSICTGTNNLAFSDPGSVKSGTLNQSAISITVGGTPYEATCSWGSFRKLIIDPVDVLPQYSDVVVTITNVARVFGGTTALTGVPITRTFKTVPRFSMTHSVNGFQIVTASGNNEVREVSGNPRGTVIINRTGPSTPNVILSSTFVLNADKVSSVKLFKIGANPSGADNDPAYTYTVCASACTTAELTNLANLNLSTITPVALRPTDGSNTYVFEISTTFKKFYKAVNFVYAPLVSDPYASISNVAKLIVDNGSGGLDRIAKLLERFIMSDGGMTNLSRTATFTNGATTITVNSATSIVVGMGVSGPDIPFGTTVTSISGTNIGISKATMGARTNVAVNFQADNFKIGGKVFANFYREPVWNYNATSRRQHCLDYSSRYNTFDYVRAYGDHGNYSPTLGAPWDATLYGDGYCGVDGTVSDFVGSGCSTQFDIDGYIDDILIPNVLPPGSNPVGGQNISAALVPNTSGDLVVDVIGKKAYINLEAIARNRGTCWIIIPVMSGGNLFQFDAPVELNQGASTPANRLSRAKTILSVNSQGSLGLAVKTPYTPTDPITGNFYISEWTNNLTVGSMTLIASTSWVAEIFAFITEAIGNNMVPTIKPKIVQGVLRDILEKVAPAVLNAIVTQVKVGPQLTCNSTSGNATLTGCTSTTNVTVGMAVYGPNIQPNTVVSSKTANSITMNKTATSTLSGVRYTFGYDGINVSLPSYLPYPLNGVSLNVGVQLEQTSNAITTTVSAGYLEADVKLGIVANNTNNNPRPPAPQGTDSFAYFKNPNDKLNTQKTRLGTSPKFQHALLSLHPDAVNQALYHLWKSGSINLNLTREFANQIATNQWAGDTIGYRNSTRLLQIFETLLRAESMIKILAPGKSNLRVCPIGQTCTGLTNTVLMEPDDDIEITLNPIGLPVVKPLPLSQLTQFTCPDEASQCVTPRVQAELGDIELSIKGRKCSSRNPTSKLCTAFTGVEYNLVKVRASLSSRADVNFVPFSNPKCNPTLNPGLAGCDTSQNGLTAVSLTISANELKYTLEVLEGPSNNPQGLNPQAIWEILDPTVKSLIVPLVNYILEEIPLPRMAGCGLTLENPDSLNGAGLKTLPVRVSDYVSGKEFILGNTRLGGYVFNGDCNL